MADAPMVFNGVDGATGGYLLAGVDHHAVARLARGELGALDDEAHDALVDIAEYAGRTRGKSRGLMAGVDPRRLDQTGWGVIWPRYRGRGQLDGHDATALNARVAAVREALAPLVEHRRAQASRVHAHRFRELEYTIGLPPGGAPRPASKHQFLGDQRPYVDGTMPADPDKLPYYLLIVGGPAHVPYRFQYQLDVQYAVGRLHFDTLDAYADYARAVVAAEAAVEQGAAPRARRVALWGPRTPGDRATELSADHLLTPLAGWLGDDLFADPAFGGWTLDAADVAHGTRDRLASLLGGARTPALAFTASHGLYYPPSDPRHASHTGALLCHDWTRGTPPRDADLFAGDDLAPDADLAGLVAFHFACYGAGLPAHDDFAAPDAARAPTRPLVARLPQRLLGRPGGALAVIGHVDRAWGASFYARGRREGAAQLTTFQSALRLLLEGHPVGHAMDPFGARYAATTSDLAHAIDQHAREGHSDEYADDAWMADRWLESNDARNYAVIGDPAVRLAVAPPGAEPAPSPEPVPEVAATPDLAATVEALIGALATAPLDVRTSTAPDVAAALADPARATLRAATRIAPDGALDTVLDAALADDPAAIAALHRALAAAALPHRAATLDALARALAVLRAPTA